MGVNILSIGTAVPEFRINQSEVFEFMSAAHGMEGEEKQRLKALYRASFIKERYSVVPDYGTLRKEDWKLYPPNDELEPFPSTAVRNDIYRKEALPLSLKAVDNCLGDFERSKITHLITVSCTGLYAPGLDIDLVNNLNLNRNTARTCINFMGCYAAITALKTANQICKADDSAVVLIVSVELCTLHFQKESSEDNLIANALFSDGAAAALVSSTDEGQKSLCEIKNFQSAIYPDGKDEMAWNVGNTGFQMKLTTYVPELIASGVKQLIDELSDDEPDLYAIHPGGKKILDVAEQALGISKTENRAAHHVLRHYGNMSSPTILFVLKEIIESLEEGDQRKSLAAMAFGPGLTIETVSLTIS